MQILDADFCLTAGWIRISEESWRIGRKILRFHRLEWRAVASER